MADAQSLRLLDCVRVLAQSATPVLIRGETGCGKDLLADLLHYAGVHHDQPLVKFDCSSVPADLLEAELFGCEAGAGEELKRGRLELAGGGTIVLDEVAAVSWAAQGKLLQALREGRFERVASNRSIPLQARVIALTTVDLERAAARRTFREDLYLFLRESHLIVPPLRERPADIRPLAYRFLRQWKELHRKPQVAFSAAALEALESYAYPANVRELRNIVEYAVVYGASPEILLQDLPPRLRGGAIGATKKISLEELERTYIAEVLDYTRGKKTLAASILGISRKTLLEKRKRYGLG